MTHPAYVSLGDSMSIDCYPDLDHADRQHVRLPATGLGAASLLARNDDAVWPEFVGQDLATRFPGIDCHFLAMDGATTDEVLVSQIPALETVEGGGDVIVTLTAGGNDLLSLLGAADGKGAAGVERMLRNLDAILDAVQSRLPRAVILVGNVYDPTDGTGDLEGHRLRPQEMRWLRDYNAGVARVCAARGARFVDVHAHFAGHGLSAPAAERWYWTGSLIEPGAVGASEIRRLWLAAFDAGAAGARTRR
ncbi:MAG TPA: SGNH/GDSL hydrolase family protein [Vicinamibacteria bacterium]|nr:SGNH/GDSL hydrolase family protein [Vicinamibacteria bacterium]